MALKADEFLANALRTSRDRIEVAAENLQRIGCIPQIPNIAGHIIHEQSLPLSAFGRELMRALAA
jgi:hypothetical protein